MSFQIMMHRRELFGAAIAAGAAPLAYGGPGPATSKSEKGSFISDTNVSLFQWPCRRLPLDQPAALVRKLRTLGISEAWAGSFEGLLHRDVGAVNARLARTCGRYPELVPIGSVNPVLPGWEEDLRRCAADHGMPGIRLHPNYHGYTLADPRFGQLLKRAAAAGLFVQIAVAMEDTRTQHPLLQVADVDLAPLPDWMPASGGEVQLLNYRPRLPELEALANTAGIYFDTARVEGTDGIGQLLRSVPRERVLFGTHAPFLIPEAALIRICESGLDDEQRRHLLRANAEQLRKARTR